MDFNNWVNQVVKWLRALFQKPKTKQKSKIIRQVYGEFCAVIQVERDTRGAVSTYRIISKTGGYDLLITLDNLRDLNSEYIGDLDDTPIIIETTFCHDYTIRQYRYSVFVVYPNCSIKCIGSWDVDLVGAIYNINLQELVPKRIFTSACLSILRISPTLGKTWQDQIERTDWSGFLDNAAKKHLGQKHSIKAIPVV